VVAVFTPVPWIAATPWLLVALTTSPIVPVIVVVGLLALLFSQARRANTPRRARLMGAVTWWVAYGPLVIVWFFTVGSIEVGDALFILLAAGTIVGALGLAGVLAFALYEFYNQSLAKLQLQAHGPMPSGTSG